MGREEEYTIERGGELLGYKKRRVGDEQLLEGKPKKRRKLERNLEIENWGEDETLMGREEMSEEMVGSNGGFRNVKLKQTLLKTLNWKEVIMREIIWEMLNDAVDGRWEMAEEGREAETCQSKTERMAVMVCKENDAVPSREYGNRSDYQK